MTTTAVEEAVEATWAMGTQEKVCENRVAIIKTNWLESDHKTSYYNLFTLFFLGGRRRRRRRRRRTPEGDSDDDDYDGFHGQVILDILCIWQTNMIHLFPIS